MTEPEPDPSVKAAPEFMHYVRERDVLKAELAAVQLELAATQVQLYDAEHKLTAVERAKVDIQDSGPKTKPTNKKTEPKKKTPPQPAKPNGKSKPVQAGGRVDGNKGKQTNGAAEPPADGVYHPPIPIVGPGTDTYSYYWKLAESFPTLPMYQIMDAERKFAKADTDSSGSIDRDELDKVLTDTVTMFTPAKVDEIFKEVDTDNSDAVDFYEVLVIVNKLNSRRKTNLPTSVQQNYARTCSIQ